MRAAGILPILFLFVSVAASDEKNPEVLVPLEKWNTIHLEKMWGLKLTKVYGPTKGGTAGFACVLEFTKDAEDVKAVQKAFGFVSDNPQAKPQYEVYFFDADKVLIHKAPFRIDGPGTQITGKAGDAFRIVVIAPGRNLDSAKKAEFRPVDSM
jgi:hypothetical protein